MSIVTDALNRLQSARAHAVRPTSVGSHDSSKPAEPIPTAKEDQKKSTRDAKFLAVSVGSFLVVAVMALGAYWWGKSVVEVPTFKPRSLAQSSMNPKPLVDDASNGVASDQTKSTSSDTTLENPSREQATVSQTIVREEVTVSSQALEEKPNEPQIQTPSKANAEPVLDKESPLQKVASLSVEQEPLSVRIKREEVKKHTSIGVADAEDVTKMETVDGPTSGTAEQKVSNLPFPSMLEKSEQLSRSDFSLGISTEEDLEDQQIVGRPFEAQEKPVLENKSDVQEVEKMLVTREPAPRAAKGGGKRKTLSESRSSDSTSKSLRSVPTVFAKKTPLSSQMNPSQGFMPSKNVVPPVSTVQSRLSPEQRLVKAQLLIEQQSHADAMEVLEPLFVDPPSTWEPWFWMGTAQLGLENFGKAEEAFMEGLVRDDTVPYLWVQRAVIAQQRGQYGQAMDALRQAELLDPELPEVQLNLAYNLEQQGHNRLARRHYQRYLSLTEGKSTYHAVRRKVLERVLRMGSS